VIDQDIIEAAKEALVQANKEKAAQIVKAVLEDGGDPLELMNQAFIPGIGAVGDLFGRGRLFLPELISSADTMKAVTDLVNASLTGGAAEERKRGRVLIATVQGDVHDIGKCIVVSLMQANGFEVIDMGRDVANDKIIERAVEVAADIIGTSALLTTTMPRQKDLETALKKAGLRERFKTIVGGAPVTPRWAARIGADAYAEDAQDAVKQAQALIDGK
jgi:trimethylamine corrinoid protein